VTRKENSFIFTARRTCARAVRPSVHSSLCPFACLSDTHVLCDETKKHTVTHCQHFDTVWKDNNSSILARTPIGGRHPITCKICSRDPPRSNNADFDRLAYNVSTKS